MYHNTRWFLKLTLLSEAEEVFSSVQISNNQISLQKSILFGFESNLQQHQVPRKTLYSKNAYLPL